MTTIRTRTRGRAKGKKYPISKSRSFLDVSTRGKSVDEQIFSDDRESFSSQYFGKERRRVEAKGRLKDRERHKREREFRRKYPYHLNIINGDDELGNFF